MGDEGKEENEKKTKEKKMVDKMVKEGKRRKSEKDGGEKMVEKMGKRWG